MKKPVFQKLFLLIMILFGFIPIMAQETKTLSINDDLKLIPIQDSIFIHISYHSLKAFGRFPSNGLVIIRKGKAILIDTPMTNEKTELLVSYLKNHMNIEVTQLIIGHFHDDCMGGLEYLQSIGLGSLAHELTIKKCQELDLPIPGLSFTKSFSMDFYGEEIICKYFGAGHTIDNITVYFPAQHLLFGGCLIKSMSSKNLGNTEDAIIKDWAASVQKIIQYYPEVQWVVPGHGAYGGPELLNHTIDLIQLETLE